MESKSKKDNEKKGFLDLGTKSLKDLEPIVDEEVILKCANKDQPLIIGKDQPQLATESPNYIEQ